MITLRQLAEKCNVSIATVSNILNGKSNVSEETRKRVLEIVAQTGYKPNYLARGLRASKTKTIGVIVDELCAFSSPFLVEGITQKSEEEGYKVVIKNLCLYRNFDANRTNTPEFLAKVTDAFDLMNAIKVDGIIYVAAFDRKIDFIPENLEVPVVVTYSETQSRNADLCTVGIDDYNAAFEMTDFLVKKGYKNISLITGIQGNLHTEHRLQGFKAALEKNSLSYNSDLVCDGNWNRADGYKACKNLPEDSFKKGSAVFCFNDEMAAGVYDFISEKGLVPGIDIAVAGFDNQIFAQYMNPPLTTMEIPLIEIGRKSGEIILKKISGTETESKNYLIPCRLIDRKSV